MEDIIYCCKVTDDSGDSNSGHEMLTSLDHELSSWEDKEEKIAFHTIYCENKLEAEEIKELLERLCIEWRDYGIQLSNPEIFELKKEDWAEVWKKYFNIITISPRLIIKPSWLDYNPGPEQVIVEIDPGMSFGTGQHATTSFCLKMIDQLAVSPEPGSFLDAGCGSGILSIAASLLGYDPVDAFDYDPDAIMVAAENIEKNIILGDAINLSVADASKFKSREEGYDVVAANILGSVLLNNREIIFNYVKPGGHLILAGILNEEFETISQAYQELGLIAEHQFSEKEWTSGLFKRNPA